jgi:hypothetical protein
MRNDLVLQLTGQPSLENILRRNRLRWFGHVNRMDNDQGYPLLTKKTLFASFKDAKRLPHGIKLRWRDKIAKNFAMLDIKNCRQETQDNNKWRKTINRDVRHTTVYTDLVRIVQEHEERAANRRAEEEISRLVKQNTTTPLTNPLASTTDDATCTQCGRICKNKRGLKVHQRTCVNKKVIDKCTAVVAKIIDLLIKNECICPNQDCGRLLKPQGATSHVKACAKLF